MKITRNNLIAFLKVFPIILIISLGLFDVLSRIFTGTGAFTPDLEAHAEMNVAAEEIASTSEKGIIPVHLTIPTIAVSAKVEQVGRNSDGTMANPSSMRTVGWYSLGYKPGEVGNAVLDGHLDNALGVDAVFARLGELRGGDSIYVEDGAGVSQHYRVREARSYDYDGAPLDLIFGSQGKHQLVLVTCDGVWNKQKHSYDKRLVVFAELAE